MVFITKKMENVMSMYDERVAELEALLEASDARYLEYEKRLAYEMKHRENFDARYHKDTGVARLRFLVRRYTSLRRTA